MLCLDFTKVTFLSFKYLFQKWEGWTMLDSSYFCFITLTTIGFGDLTPDQKNTDGEVRIALCSLYLLFGIAMICMSFNLVQEEVINNVKGIINFGLSLLTESRKFYISIYSPRYCYAIRDPKR